MSKPCEPTITSYTRFKSHSTLDIYNALLNDIITERTKYRTSGEREIITTYDAEIVAINGKNEENQTRCDNLTEIISHQDKLKKAQMYYLLATAENGISYPPKELVTVKDLEFLRLDEFWKGRTQSGTGTGYGFTQLGHVTKERNKLIEDNIKDNVEKLNKLIEENNDLIKKNSHVGNFMLEKEKNVLTAELAYGYSLLGFHKDAIEKLDTCTLRTRTWFRAYAHACRDNIFKSTAYENVFLLLGGKPTDPLKYKEKTTTYSPEQIEWIELYRQRPIKQLPTPVCFEKKFITLYKKHPIEKTLGKKTADSAKKAASELLNKATGLKVGGDKPTTAFQRRVLRRMEFHEFA